MRKLFYHISNLSLQRKLMISYIVIMLIPMIVIPAYIFKQFTGNYVQDVIKKNEVLLEVEKINIDNNIEAMERAAQMSVSDKEVLRYLYRIDAPNAEELLEFNDNAFSNLERIQFHNPNIEHIRLFADNSNVNEIWPIIFHENRIVDQPWYKEVTSLNGRQYWSFQKQDYDLIQRYVTEQVDSQPKISLLREVERPKGNHVGILQVDMLLANFFPKAYSNIQDTESRVIILDRDMNVFTNVEHPFFDRLDVHYMKEQFETQRALGNQSFEFRYNGIPYHCMFTFIESLDAYILNVVLLEPIFKEVERTRNQIVLASLVLIGILFISTYFLNSLILKKLHALTESMKKVRQGDFNIDIDIKGHGEVGELAHHFRKMLKKINELIADAVNKQAATRETELKTLKNQIDSHFLYNTLENIKMMAEIEQQTAISDALTSLGGMMRYNLKWTSEYLKLQDEINHIKNYISIMNIRFDEGIKLKVDIPPAYLDHEVLKMSLQPIVENAVKHAFSSKLFGRHDMCICIRVLEESDSMIISVTDNGIGMSQEQVERLNEKISVEDEQFERLYGQNDGSGIGLRNVNQRIKLYYGREYGVSVESREGEFTSVVLRLPSFMLMGRREEYA